jgi:predicted nucleic acid-binding protein
MRSQFPGHFKPNAEGFSTLWKECIFSVDANVLLNLYRYSSDTRQELERSLTSVKDRLFLPNQAAQEFLKNRLSVTAGQAEEYTKAIKAINDISVVVQ